MKEQSVNETNLGLDQVESRIRSYAERLDQGKAAVLILAVLGLFSFFSALDTSLRDTEGMYGVIAREMIRNHEWLHLTYEGQPYLNKPPLHFWLMGISSFLFGQGEWGFRFPTALSAMATMMLVYYFGKLLYNRRTGFIAALIMATNYVFVWYSKRALLDTELAFFITLALFFFYLSYHDAKKMPFYLTLSFISCALGTMIKGLLGMVLPAIVILGFVFIKRKELRLRAKVPALVGATIIVAAIALPYYLILGDAFNRSFFWGTINRFFGGGSKPYLWYFYMIFLDVFPWAFFLPSAVAFIWPRSFREIKREDCFLLLWGIGFFLFFTLAKEKSDHYILPLIPPLALLIARFWDYLLSSDNFSKGPYFIVPMFYLLAFVSAAGLAIGPIAISRRHGIPLSFVPIWFQVLTICICFALVYFVYKRKLWASYAVTVALALGFTFGLLQFVLPAFDRYVSGKQIGLQTSSIIDGAKIAAFFPEGHNLREDIIFYLNLGSPIPKLKNQDEFIAYLGLGEKVFCIMPKNLLLKMQEEPDIAGVSVVKEFSYGRQDLVLVSNKKTH